MAINYANKEDYPPSSLLGLPPLILVDNILTRIARDKKEKKTVFKLRAWQIICFRDCSANFGKGLDELKSVACSIRSGDYAYAMLTLHYDGSRLAAELLLHKLIKKGKLEKLLEALLKHFVGKYVNLSKVPYMQFDSCRVLNCGSITNHETQYFNPSCSVKCAIQTEYEIFRMRLKEVIA